MIDGHAVDILQIDPGRAGGLFESRLVADMAEVALMPVLVHQPYGPIYDAMAVQLAAMIPNLLAVEWPKHYYPVEPADLRVRLVKEPLQIVRGEIVVPPSPASVWSWTRTRCGATAWRGKGRRERPPEKTSCGRRIEGIGVGKGHGRWREIAVQRGRRGRSASVSWARG